MCGYPGRFVINTIGKYKTPHQLQHLKKNSTVYCATFHYIVHTHGVYISCLLPPQCAVRQLLYIGKVPTVAKLCLNSLGEQYLHVDIMQKRGWNVIHTITRLSYIRVVEVGTELVLKQRMQEVVHHNFDGYVCICIPDITQECEDRLRQRILNVRLDFMLLCAYLYVGLYEEKLYILDFTAEYT